MQAPNTVNLCAGMAVGSVTTKVDGTSMGSSPSKIILEIDFCIILWQSLCLVNSEIIQVEIQCLQKDHKKSQFA